MPTPIAQSSIAQEAFQIVELAPISSFADDTEQASDANLYFQFAMRFCLERADWTFASSLVALSEVTPGSGLAEDDRLPYAFALPGDCLAIREVRPANVKWRLDETILRTDQAAPLTIRYTRLITDETKLPEAFRSAVALALALRLAPRWLSTQTKRQDIERRMIDALTLAMRSDARNASAERYDDQEDVPLDWVSVALR